MKIENLGIEITNVAKYPVDGAFLERIAKRVFETVGQQEISLVLVDEKKIREINKKYRHKDQPTDVLSFEGLNEIFICPKVVKAQAKSLGVPFKNELARVLIHGILHLKGYDHEKGKKEAGKMREMEEKILKII